MTQYLLAISLGPVQSLIEAGRKTRDLWCGSWLLSEAAKAAALTLQKYQPGCLIFPCPTNPNQDLQPQSQFQEEQANIANVIRALVTVDDEDHLRKLARDSQNAAVNQIIELSEKARKLLGTLPLHKDIWDKQKDDILETFAVWIEHKEENYPAQSQRLSSLLAARKSSRDFEAMKNTRVGIPKCSLDGAFESVINISHKKRTLGNYQRELRRLAIFSGEELDVLGVTKRMAGDAEQFTPFARIAADSWLNNWPEDVLSRLKTAYQALVQQNLATRVKGNSGI
ncbi:MAG: type III-B CRISPR-associated protein Cas10/Cmr2 [Reinekea sp.]